MCEHVSIDIIITASIHGALKTLFAIIPVPETKIDILKAKMLPKLLSKDFLCFEGKWIHIGEKSRKPKSDH